MWIEVDMVVVEFSVRDGHEPLDQRSEEGELREGHVSFDGVPIHAKLHHGWVLDLATPVYALAGFVGVDGGAEFFPDSAGLGGGVFDVAPRGEGDEGDFGGWSRHCW